jgi:hypothetical protein
VFVTGTTIQAAPFNQNFTAVATAVNSVDNTQVGAAGFFASQIIPTTGGQATFGGSLGFTFPAGITLSGTGFFRMGTAGTAANPALQYGNTLAGSSLTNVGALGQTVGGVVGTAFEVDAVGINSLLTLDGTGSLGLLGHVRATSYVLSSAAGDVPTNIVAGEIGTATSSATGRIRLGGGSNCGAMDFTSTNAGGMSFTNVYAGGYIGLFGGAYTNASDERFKANIGPVDHGLETVLKLQPASFNLRAGEVVEERRSHGFVAQHVATLVPEIVSTDEDGFHGVSYDAIIPMTVRAIQELHAAFTAYVTAHP